MSVCAQCGAQLGLGRFCLNCGHAIGEPPVDDWRTGTAERPAVPPEESGDPLYADETPATSSGSHRRAGPGPSRLAASLPWMVAAAVLLAFAGTGTWLLLRGGDDEPAAPATGSTSASVDPTPQEPAPSATAEPSDEPSDEPAGDPEEVAPDATVTVPATAPPNEDIDGNVVSYAGFNMLDGLPETTWRMPGDGTGESLLVELAVPTTITSLGLVNGYAKTARTDDTAFDWYAGNRRVLTVEWVFDDGTVVPQDLVETRDVQTVEIEPVTTQSVELRLVTVSPPGEGPSARDFTAISELSLLGTPA